MDFVYSYNNIMNKYDIRMPNIHLKSKFPKIQQIYSHNKQLKLRIKNKFSILFGKDKN